MISFRTPSTRSYLNLACIALVSTLSALSLGCDELDDNLSENGTYLVKITRNGTPVKGNEAGKLILLKGTACYDANGEIAEGGNVLPSLEFTVDNQGEALVEIREGGTPTAGVGCVTQFTYLKLLQLDRPNGGQGENTVCGSNTALSVAQLQDLGDEVSGAEFDLATDSVGTGDNYECPSYGFDWTKGE